MTRSGLLAVFAAALFAAAAVGVGLPELFLAATVCVGLVLLALGGVGIRPPLEAQTGPVQRRIQAGRPLEMALRLTNRSRRRLVNPSGVFDLSAGRGTAVLQLGRLPPGATALHHYSMPTDRRGWRTVGPLLVEVEDPFGLARRRHVLASWSRVLVWPRIDELGPMPETLEVLAEQRSDAPQLSETATDLHSLRRFEPGDNPHRIHWPSSTRYGELLVRRFESTQRPETLLYLETDAAAAEPKDFERMVSAAAGLACRAAAERGSVRLITRGDAEVRSVEGASEVLDALALVRQQAHDSAPEPLLPPGAARMILLAVVGESPDHLTPNLARFTGPRITLRFWRNEPPGERPDEVAIGPDERTATCWERLGARRSATRLL